MCLFMYYVCMSVGTYVCMCKFLCICPYSCQRANVPGFGRVFVKLKFTDITQNTNIQILTVTEIMAIEF